MSAAAPAAMGQAAGAEAPPPRPAPSVGESRTEGLEGAAQGREATRRKLQSALQVARGAAGEADWTPFETALADALDTLGWRGAADQLLDALPHVDPIDSLEAMALVLRRVGVSARPAKKRPSALKDSDFPAVLVTKDGPRVATDAAAFKALRRDGLVGWRAIPICSIQNDYAETRKFATRAPTFFDHFREVAQDDLIGVLSLTGLINIFVLALPLYAVSVYNLALPADASSSLTYFTLLAVLALLAEDYFRGVRGRLMASVAAKLHARIMVEGVRKRLDTRLSTLERASIAGLLAQFKRMETVLGFFQSGNARSLIDAPFVVVFLVALWLLGGWIVLAPLIGMAVLIACALISPAFTRVSSPWSEASRWQTKELVRETVIHADAIREAGAEAPWLDRVSHRLDRDAARTSESDCAAEASSHLGQAILGASAVATLWFGAWLVVHEQLSIGGLMAATILNLRILGPVHALMQSLGQLRELRDDIGMIEQMLAHEEEANTVKHAANRRLAGALRLNRVGHRQPHAADFALRNVSFELNPGDRLAVVGPGGSGRSLLLRVAVGLTTPTLGTVTIDGLPLSQIASGERRRVFGYAPARPEFLYGTIAQNMRFARMDVGDFEVEELLEAIGLPLLPEQFPEGLHTRLTEMRRQQLGVTAMQKLNIARTILSRRPLLAFDDVFSDLDPPSRAAVFSRLDQSRGEQSVLIVAAHRDVVEACDTTLALRHGAIAAYGPTHEVLPTITNS
ncbi:MAG: ATP-binding cassette domain-containing protein [Pseudomonadota bacterium]